MIGGDTFRTGRRACGFTYIAVLLLVAATGIATARLAEIWSTSERREREAELLFIGEAYRRAIGSYYEASPGSVKQYPRRLEDLLDDSRFVGRRRHLRKLYRDPLSGHAEWGIVRAHDGGVAGVFSRSEAKPIKIAGFGVGQEAFNDAERYSVWEFVHRPVARDIAPEARPTVPTIKPGR